MYNKNILIATDCLDQSNLPEFIHSISEIKGFINFRNLFARDYAHYFMRYGHGPEDLNKLRAFVIERYNSDAEAYLFGQENCFGSGVFTLNQVPPLMFLYEFINYEGLGLGSFVPYNENEKPHQVTDEIGLVKISCPIKLVTNDPVAMRQNLSEFLVRPAGLF